MNLGPRSTMRADEHEFQFIGEGSEHSNARGRPAEPDSCAFHTIAGIAAMMPDDKDTDAIADDSIKEVIGEPFQIDSPEVGFEKMISIGPTSRVEHKMTQYAVKILRQ